MGFGIVIGISITIYLGALILLYIEKVKNKQYQKQRAENFVKDSQRQERMANLQVAINHFKEDRDLLFSKYGNPDLELCFKSEHPLYKTNIQDFIYVFKSSDCIFAFGKTFRCGDYLHVELIDTQKVEIGGRPQFENVFRYSNVMNHHLMENYLINNETKESINITEKTEEIAKEKGLEYYTISHYSYLEINPLHIYTNGIPFRFQTPIMYNDEEKLNGLIKFFTIATDYSIHLSKERIVLLTFLDGFTDKNIFELDAFCVKTHIYIDNDELQRDLIRHAVNARALSNFESDFEISQITEARNKAIQYMNDLLHEGKRLITFIDYEYKKKFDDIKQGVDISPIVIVDGTTEPPKPSIETIEIDFRERETFRKLNQL